MKKAQLLQSLSWPMLVLGTVLASVPYIAVIRAALGIDETMNLAYTSTIMFLIAGYMAAIGGMIYLVRQTASNRESLVNQAAKTAKITTDQSISHSALAKPHWLGLTLLLPIPFISFFVLYFFWRRTPNHSEQVELEYKQAISFQITVHLYELLSFFLMFILIGLLVFFMVLALHLFATLYVAIKTQSGSNTHYWANIRIV